MFIDVDGAKIYTAAFGPEAAPVILGIGGWIGSWELWVEPFAMLSRHWRTVAYDHRGTGATSAPVESITFGRLVDDVFAVMDALGIERCVLAAESAGALTALAAAHERPERIAGLVLVDALYYQAPIRDDDPFLQGLQHQYAATIDWFVTACVPEPHSDHIKRWGRQILGRASQEAAIALYRSSSEPDLRADLGDIKQRTLILHGAADAIVRVEEAQRLAAALPHAHLSIVPEAGHVPTITRPQVIADAIDHFFATSN
ncbi:MAG: alpha/beta hydrolase [Caldilineaceae bacterium]